MAAFAIPFFAALALMAGDALAAKATFRTEVPANQWRALRVKRLPKEASLAVNVTAAGPINVILIHERELNRFPEPVSPLFVGSAERRLSFKVTVPLSGDYYVILDNRKGAEPRAVRLTVEALRPQKAKPPARREKGLDAT